MTDDTCLVFFMKALLHLLSRCYWAMKKHFSEMKITSIMSKV